MEILYCDSSILVCVKPPRVLSTDEPGGLPDLVRQALADPTACIRTVHRLDRVVGGLMVLARSKSAASILSQQIRTHQFQKEYLAVTHGVPQTPQGTMRDLLQRSKQERKTYVVKQLDKGVQEAVLDYETLEVQGASAKIRIVLRTGRTHQIRAQFSSRGLPLVGDRKYTLTPQLDDGCEIALWSYRLSFLHPDSGEKMEFIQPPPRVKPWDLFV